MAYGAATTPLTGSGQMPGSLPGATAPIQNSTFQDGSVFSNTGVAQNQQAQTSLSNLGVSGTAYNTFIPPNVNTPVSTNHITSGGLNIPASAPSPDPNGSNLVAGVAATVGMSQPGQSDTPGLDAATGLNQGTQQANSLYSNTMQPGQQQAQDNINQGIQQYGQQSAQLGNRAGDTQTAYQQYGVNQDLNKVNDLTTQLANLNAQYNNAAQSAETQGINSGTPSVVYQGQQAAIQRQQAVQQGSLAAQLSAAQGNYQNAKALADQTVSLKYQDIQDKLDATKNFLSLNQDNLSNLEKVQADKISAAVQQQQVALDQQKSVSSLAIQYPNAQIDPNSNLVQATKKASAWIAQNPTAGQKPVVIGSTVDDYGNKIDVYGLVGANGQITPLDYNSSNGNTNFGMSTGTIQGLPAYNTAANNPGVNRPTRNNNPGNIKVSATSASYPGVVGVESTAAADGGNFLIFDNPQDGLNAIGQLISTSKGYANMSAAQAIKRYNGGGSYSASDLGLDPNADFQTQLQNPQTLQTVLEGIAKHEGFSVGNSGSSGNAVGTTGSQAIDSTTPNYSSALVGSTGLTQSAIDQNALAYATTGKMPSLGNGSTGQIKIAKQAILNRAAELNQGGSLAANKAQITALSSSLTQQTQYLNTLQRSLSNAEDGFNQLTTAFQGSGINTSDSSILNKTVNDIKKNVSGGDIFAFNAGLSEVANEYSNVFSRGGQVTESTRAKADSILNGNISLKDLLAVQNELQAMGKVNEDGAQYQVTQLQNQLNGFLNPNASKTGTNNSTSYSAGTVVSYQGKNYIVDDKGNMTPQ